MLPTATLGGVIAPRCVMCGASALHTSPGTVALCSSPYCRSRHATLPPSQRCRVCSRPLTVSQWAAGHCENATCREEVLVRRPLEAARQAYADLIATVPARRRRSAAQHGIPREERDSYRLAILPFNSDRPSALPQERRDAFEAHLRSNITEARERLAAGDAPTPPTVNVRASGDSRSDAEWEAERKLMGAGCVACRGQCCQLGGNHAFNEVNTMMLYLRRFPEHDDETIVSRYLSYIAPRTLSRGCVFQAEGGCSLPRDLRSDVCNRFYCASINVLRNQFAAGDPVRAYFLHDRDGRLVGDRFVEIPVAKE